MNAHPVTFAILTQESPRSLCLMFSEPVCKIARQNLNEHGIYTAVDDPEDGHIVDSILELHGIERVEVTPHSVYITKALLVGWNDLLNSILLLVQTRLETRMGTDVRLTFIRPKLLETVVDGINDQYHCWLLHGCGEEPKQQNVPSTPDLPKKPRLQ
jgi:hypothetical protein